MQNRFKMKNPKTKNMERKEIIIFSIALYYMAHFLTRPPSSLHIFTEQSCLITVKKQA